MTPEEIVSELESLEKVGVYFDQRWGKTRETFREDLDYVRVSDIIDLISRIKEDLAKPTVQQVPEIWGDGWYALYDKESDYWWVAPIKYFDEHGHCPDGWEWDKPDNMSDEEFDDFVDEFGCTPIQPKGFNYCMESCITCNTDATYEYQKECFEKAGYTVRIWKP
jgi:hypothetical protein